MTYMHPVFAVAVDCERLSEHVPNHEEALQFLPTEYIESSGRARPIGCWVSASHNWWYQAVVRDACNAYPGHDEVRYLLDVVAIISRDSLATMAQAIRRLIAAIKCNPRPFVECTSWWGATAEQIVQSIDEAVISRDIDDDTREVFGNYFSFLLSQAAALEEAQASGKCLLYFQPQP